MLAVGINVGELLTGWALTKTEVKAITQAVLVNVTNEVHRQIIAKAQQHLKKSRAQYIRNVNRPVFDGKKGSITLTGMLPNMIEQGAGAIDFKSVFASSDKAHRSSLDSGGWYLTIPFRHAVSGAMGDSEVFSSVMPQAVYNIAKNLKSSTSAIDKGSLEKGGGIDSITLAALGMDSLGSRAPFSEIESGETFDEYVHKSSKYEGLIREEKDYEAVSSGSYVTFRRVSNNSDKNSWVHPGIIAYNLMSKAMSETEFAMITGNTIDEQLSNLGFKS